MRKELEIYTMTFEVTRKCNKKCIHCLRGNSQNVDMTQKIIEEALRDVTAINTLSLSGGEPTLNVEVIRNIKDHIIRNEIFIGNFFIVLNGTKYDEELVDTLYELYDYITENYGDSELCVLTISNNQFQTPDDSIVEMYSHLPFYNEYKANDIPKEEILNTGSAYKNGVGVMDVEVLDLDIEVSDSQINVNYGNVYINALGDVVPGCDLSYEDQEKYKLGNVLDTSLLDILSNAK